MKKHIWEWILTVLLITIVAVFAIGMILLSFGVITPEQSVRFINTISSSPLASLVLAFCGLILILMSGVLICIKISSARRPTTYLIAENANGSCFIAVTALNSLVERFYGSYSGVEACFANFITKGESVSVGVRLIVKAGASLADLTVGTNGALKEYLTSMTGMQIGEVDVLIESVSAHADE